jgi:DNA polymerase-3 subunit beta
LAVDYEGPALSISFNAQYVLDFLNVVETDSCRSHSRMKVSQAVMKPVGAEGYDYTYVIMPMRI